jgi:hypothetical protein
MKKYRIAARVIRRIGRLGRRVPETLTRGRECTII